VVGETISVNGNGNVKPSHSSQAQKNECINRVTDNRCSRFFLKKGKIIEVDSDFCNHCWELQQRLKTTLATSSTPVTRFYQKPKDIYCYKDGMTLNPLKCQAKCTDCQLKHFNAWAECQRKNQIRSQRGS